MDETLIIKNFGPIKSVELKLKRFNILIGEQAAGKSTVAKILAVCRYFSYIQPFGSIGHQFYEGLQAWGLSEYIHGEETFISYKCPDYSFTAQYFLDEEYDNEGEFAHIHPLFILNLTPISDRFKNLILQHNRVNQSTGWNTPNSFFQNDVARVMNNPFYLPIERSLQSIFSLGKSSIQNMSDSLFNQFARIDQISRLFKESTSIVPLAIEYRNENGRGLVKKNTDANYYNLANAASGYQSTIPVVLAVEYYTFLRRKSKTFIIEEPELSLFPIAQNKLMTYLADKATSFGHQLIITTHSPYILTSFNNLMYAYQIGQEHAEEVNKIVDKKYWVNPDDVSAYRLMVDGTAKNIIDEDLKQINAGELDEISRSINEIWDKIAEIEFSRIDEN